MRRLYWKTLFGGLVFFGLTSVMLVAYHGARVRGRMTHCRNNLRYLGERGIELLRESWLGSPEAGQVRQGGGRRFWKLVRDVKLRGKKLDLSPFACPFVMGDRTPLEEGPLPLEAITYRGPAADPFSHSGAEFPLGADRPEDHHGRPIHVLLVKLKQEHSRRHGPRLTGEFRVVPAAPGDPAWVAADRLTRE